MFFISHDRYFLRKLATRVVELEGKKLVNFLGGYDYYRAHRRLDTNGKGGKSRPRRRVRPGLNKDQSILATRLVAVEGEIDATERRVARLEKELATSELYSDGKRSREVVTGTPPAEERPRQLVRRLGPAARRGRGSRLVKSFQPTGNQRASLILASKQRSVRPRKQ